MQRRSNIKFKNVGVAGCASLFCLLVVTLMVPLAPSSVYAEDNEASPAVEGVCGVDKTCKISEVTIALDPTTATAPSVTPTDGGGKKSYTMLTANVKVVSSGGYRVFIGSDSKTLRLNGASDAAYKLDSIESDKLYKDIPLNHWGYYADEKSDSFDAENATYHPITSVLGGAVDDVEGRTLDAQGTNGTTGKDYTIAFAANMGADLPSGTYSNQMTFSVVSDPLETAKTANPFGVGTMQELTAAKCNSTTNGTIPVGSTAQLQDNRDDKFYWVTKMPDGHCWMTQNLDLDLPGTAISSTSNQKIYNGSQMADTNASSWTPTKATQTTVSSSTVSSTATDSLSWDQGLFVVKDPTSTTSCTSSSNANMNSGTGCDDYFKNVTGWTASDDPEFTSKHSGKTYDDSSNTYDAHYLVGNWYQWAAATAGTGTDLQSDKGNANGVVPTLEGLKDASSSICPKGWRLPASGRKGTSTSSYSYTWNQEYSFGKLLKSYGWTGTDEVDGANSLSVDVLTSYTNQGSNPPLFFVRSGRVNYSGYLDYSGDGAYYWSSTAYTDTINAYRLIFRNDTAVYPSNNGARYNGFSVRCLTQ